MLATQLLLQAYHNVVFLVEQIFKITHSSIYTHFIYMIYYNYNLTFFFNTGTIKHMEILQYCV